MAAALIKRLMLMMILITAINYTKAQYNEYIVAPPKGTAGQAGTPAASPAPSSSWYPPQSNRPEFESQNFTSSFSNIWSPDHQSVSSDGRLVNLTLDKSSGTGFRSNSPYYYGLFSAAIKLPAGNAAGVAITFYTSNEGVHPKNHDEIDFEFLGGRPGEAYTIQTNVYGNGSTSVGREQRYRLWFDPTIDFHHYSILWTPNHTVFSIDGVPIRELKNLKDLGGQYPSKPMSLYATIWDASSWATDGGRCKINYTFAPFVASYNDLVLHGCPYQPHRVPRSRSCVLNYNMGNPFFSPFLTSDQEMGLQWVRENYMIYDYCTDTNRYPQPLPECRQIIT